MKRGKRLAMEALMLVLSAVMALPLYYVVITTFKTPAEATASPLGLPSDWQFGAYADAWVHMQYPRAFGNTLYITCLSVAGVILLTAMAAYPLARRAHPVYRAIFVFFLAGLMVPFQMQIVPLYRLASALEIMNTRTGTSLIIVFTNLSFSLFLFRGFIRTVPVEIEEQAFIDGSSVLRTFWRITFPLLLPVIATLTILNSISIWNDFLTPLLFLHSRDKGVILQEVYRNVGQFSVDWTAFFPMLVLGILPLFAAFLLLQKYIVKGIASGAVKL